MRNAPREKIPERQEYAVTRRGVDVIEEDDDEQDQPIVAEDDNEYESSQSE